MKFDAKVRSVFVLDDKKVIFFRGRKQPNVIVNGHKKKLPSWRYWNVTFTIYCVKENKIKRMRELKLKKNYVLQVITVEKYPEGKEEPFLFKLIKYYN
jgi:hypothetical protein